MEDEAIVDPGMAQPPLPRGAKVGKAIMWIGTIWLLGWLGIIATETISWTNPAAGAMNGAIMGAILSPFLLIITLPAGLLGRLIGRWRPLRKWQLGLSLLLPGILAFSTAGQALLTRLHPERRFASLTKVDFPEDATILDKSFSGGFVADLTYCYVFTCPARETERLIRELRLSKSPGGTSVLSSFSGMGSVVPGRGWTVAEVWSFTGGARERVGYADFIELQTDATHTKVWLVCGTI